MFLKNWHITSTLYTLLGFPLIFVVNPACPCKPYKSPPSLSWDKLLDCVGEGGEKCLLERGRGRGEEWKEWGVTLEMGGIEEIQFRL